MTSNNTNSNLINAVRGIKPSTGEKQEQIGNWDRKAGFILSMQRPDIFAVMEGQARPTGADSGSNVHCQRDPPATPGYIRRRQPRPVRDLVLGDRQDWGSLCGYPCLQPAWDPWRRSQSHGGAGRNYLRVTNDTNRALQAATTMEPDEDPNHYIMQATRLRSRLAAIKKTITDRHFAEMIAQGLPESYVVPRYQADDIQGPGFRPVEDPISNAAPVSGRAFAGKDGNNRRAWHRHGSSSNSSSIIGYQLRRDLPQLWKGRTLQERLRHAWQDTR